MENKTVKRSFFAENSFFNNNLALRPDSIQRMFALNGDIYFREAFPGSMDSLAENKLRPVNLSFTCEIRKAIQPFEQLTLCISGSGWEKAVFRLEFRLLNEQGELCAVAAKYYGIFDLKTRRLCTDPAFLATIPAPEGERLLPASSRAGEIPDGLEKKGSFTVVPAWLDINGHTNNTRYGEMVYNSLSEATRGKMALLRRMEMYLSGELQCGEEAGIFSLEDGNMVTVEGIRARDGKRSFLCRLFFAE